MRNVTSTGCASANKAGGIRIVMPRGDIRPVRFYTKDRNKNVVSDFDNIYFTVKDSFDEEEYLFQKRFTAGDIEKLEDGSFQFVIYPEDTDNLQYGKYACDIQVMRGNDIKQTFAGTLTLTDEATYHGNEG